MNEYAAHEALMKQHFGLLGAVCLYVAAKMRVADEIAGGNCRNEALAGSIGMDPKTLHRIMRVLCSENVFHEQAPGEYALTPLSQRLRRDVEGSFGPYVETISEFYFDVLPGALSALQQDQVPLEYQYGKPAFDWIGETAERSRRWQQAIAGEHWPETEALMNAYDFSGTRMLADIGGGQGDVVARFLQRYHDAEAVIFDVPVVLAQTRRKFDEMGLGGRCEFIGGDFFTSVPVEADAYLLRHVLHDWDDAACIAILGNIRKTAKPGSKVLLGACVLKPANEPDIGKLCDIEMLMAVPGCERSAEEFGTLFDAAGIHLSRIIPTDSIISIVEGEVPG